MATRTPTRPREPLAASPLRHRARGSVLALLCALYAILYFDRVNISTAGPNGLTADLHLSTVEFGLAASAFALPYGLLQAFGGLFGDRLGPRKALTLVAALCGVFTIATGLAGGLLSLLGIRFALGLAEGTAFPTATHAMAAWLPPDRRGLGQGLVHAASRLSNALAPLVVAALISVPAVGWRGSFFVAGLAGLVWSVVWAGWFRDRPADHRAVGPVELAELDRGAGGRGGSSGTSGAPVRSPTPWRLLVRRIAPVTLTDFCYGWVLWVYLTWMPTFFAKQYDLDLKKSALFTTFTLIGGVVGDWFGGVLCDRLLRRTGDLARSRKTGLVIGLAGSALFIAPVAGWHSLAGVTVCLAVAFFFLELCNSPLWTIPMDIAPEHSGVASGLMNTGFGVAGVAAGPVFGLIAGHAGYPSALGFSAVLLVVGLVTVRFISLRPLDA